VTELGGAAQSATDLKDFADAGYDPGTNQITGCKLTDTITTYTGNTLQTADVAARVPNVLNTTATGNIGVDWANVENPTTAQNLSATNIDVDQVVASVSGAVGSVTGAVGSVTAGVTLAAGAITHASLAGNMEIVFETDFATNYNTTDNAWVTNGTTFIGTGWNTGKTGYSLTVTTGLGNQTANITGNLSGSVGSVTGAVGSVTGAVGSVTGNVDGNVTGSVGSNLELGPTEVNAQVVDALATDTYAEPGQGAPAATATLAAKINYLYKAWRNKSEQNATTYKLYNDAGTVVDQKATCSDDATDATKGLVGTGP
jgi:hypothetical protein